MKFTPQLLAAAVLSTWALASAAHVTLQDGVATSASSYRATLQVGHGCDGSATTAVQVSIPAGFRNAHPMPKPGWNLSTLRGPLAEPYESHGQRINECVLQITWTAQDAAHALPDAYYDEFVVRGTPAQPGTLWFKVLQSCEKGRLAWVEVPQQGQDAQGLKMPAARLDVIDLGPSAAHPP